MSAGFGRRGSSSARRQSGWLIADALNGAWRAEQPPLNVSAEELESVLPQLVGCGAGALAWRRVERCGAGVSGALADALCHSHRVQVLQSALFERETGLIFSLLRAAGVEPLLVKGCAAARTYAEPTLRPCGDIDLLVRADDFALAQAALKRADVERGAVDLHRRFMELADRSVNDLFARSELIDLGSAQVRVLSAEDHFGLLCVHMLRHGCWRPIWLCDIGAALEARSQNFDWRLCLGANRRRARWIVCAVGLAQKLLGASLAGVPFADEAARLPRWLLEGVLRQWETPYVTEQAPQKYRRSMRECLRRPASLPRAMRERWPNPIEATVSVNGPFNSLPRLPFQFANCLTRAARFLTNPRRISVSSAVFKSPAEDL